MPHRTIDHLAAVARRPESLPWHLWAEVRAEAAALPDYTWPSYCYLPHGAFAARLGSLGHPLGDPGQSDLAHAIALQSVLAAWRPTQGIYRYDRDVGLALACTPIDGPIPVEALRLLPEWCVYVETDPAWLAIEGLADIHGVWLTIDWHSEDGDEARMVCDHGDHLSLAMLPLPPGRTVAEAVDLQRDVIIHMIARGDDASCGTLQGPDRWERITSLWSRGLSLALYLCADPELYDQRTGATAPPRQRPSKRTKRGYRDHPPPSPAVWETAYHLGRRIREGREQAARHDDRIGPRPHIRRAHWHSYWHGSGELRALLPRWLPPIPVAADDDTPAQPTVRRVDDRTRPGSL